MIIYNNVTRRFKENEKVLFKNLGKMFIAYEIYELGKPYVDLFHDFVRNMFGLNFTRLRAYVYKIYFRNQYYAYDCLNDTLKLLEV